MNGTTLGAATRPRLLSAMTGADLSAHLDAHGSVASAARGSRLLDAVEAAGLTGRGGAAFPTHRKLRAVAAGAGRAGSVVLANGAEGEPASGKDRVLLGYTPHLVLDGIQLAAEAVGAREAFLYLPPEPALVHAVDGALRQRARLDLLPVQVRTAPHAFLAGQETAAVAGVSGRPALPRLPVPPVYTAGVRRRPTLVQNVETLAQLALVARHGPQWFRERGTDSEPGTMLFTVGGAVHGRGVVEADLGTRVADVVAAAGGADGPLAAVLVGGYHGAWLPAPAALDLPLSNQALKPCGAAVGAGVLVALPAGSCGLIETARVVRYLAGESAGQCGPCLNGLPAIAGGLAELAGSRPRRQTRLDVERWAGLVVGRGACAHPDGTVRLVRSALQVFADELSEHERGRCSRIGADPVLPVPRNRSRDGR
jgi:NADH:ubiquinone oxidoreductase subunit F (NADH-binding)